MGSITHAKVSTVPADPSYDITTTDWNDDHVITGDLPGAVPVGGIIMWSGAIAIIPANWALCDGTANSPGPDLRNTFVVGASADSGGIAKSSIEGSLKQTGGATGHSHSSHANLTHAGLTIGDHTGLTHSLAIANHPDLTHAALSHPATTLTHADHSVPSGSHAHGASTITQAGVVQASFTGSHAAQTVTQTSAVGSAASGVASMAASTLSGAGPTTIANSGGGRTVITPTVTVPIASHTGSVPSATVNVPSQTIAVVSGSHTHAASTLAQPDISVPSFSGSAPATTLTHADHSFPSLSHQAIGTHVGTDYGVHTITQPADHGTAGTLTHSFSEPNDHSISAHDTVSNVVPYFALAYIQRMA